MQKMIHDIIVNIGSRLPVVIMKLCDVVIRLLRFKKDIDTTARQKKIEKDINDVVDNGNIQDLLDL